MVITGARSEDESKKAAKQYAKMISKVEDVNKNIKFSQFEIQNIVASVNAGFGIRLEDLLHSTNSRNKSKKDTCNYHPETFPGLIFRLVKPKVVLLIFTSGKIVLTGAKTREQIESAYENIYNILRSHEKKTKTLEKDTSSTKPIYKK
jgi:transcription initiation factor TFIID TATA-box-binding protein